MPETIKAVLIGAAVLAALGLVVGGVLRHYVGGFLAKVAEEEEAAADEARTEAPPPSEEE